MTRNGVNMKYPPFNADRLNLFSGVILFVLLTVFVALLFSGKTPVVLGSRIGSDFVPFYAAGRIAAASGFTQLYDLQRQIAAERDLLPEHKGYLPFPYPPLVALTCIPLSRLPYRTAWMVYASVQLCAWILAFYGLRRIVREIDMLFLPLLALTLTFFPVLKSILIGQLTGLIAVILVGIWRLTLKSHEYLAGLGLGLLFFKPQYAVPLIGLYWLSGRVKTAASAVVTGCAIAGTGTFFTGVHAYVQWFSYLRWFARSDTAVNGYNAVSWLGFLNNWGGGANPAVRISGIVCCFLTVAIVSYAWFADGTRSDFNTRMALAVAALVLIPPHVIYYDAGLTVLTYAVLIPRIRRGQLLLLSCIWLAGMTQMASRSLGFSPLFFLVVVAFGLSLCCLSASCHADSRCRRTDL